MSEHEELDAIDRLRESNARVLAALRGLVGLTQLLLGRDDLPIGVRDALISNHRVIEAKAMIRLAQDAS